MSGTPDGLGERWNEKPMSLLGIEAAAAFEGSHIKPPTAIRHRLPPIRKSVTHKFRLFYANGDEEKFYLNVGLYPDGSPGELFIYTSKSGSTMKGLLDTWAITMSMALQHGVPLRSICDKLCFQRFAPEGFTGEEFGEATSAIDYMVRWMAKRFLNHDYRSETQ
jgi:ribonucleoside-diphosphate reductase alpha chain